jgi:hypothetical protein
MRSALRILIIVTAVCAAIKPAHAQLVDVYLGVGGAHDGSTHQQFETFGDGVLHPTTSLGGVFGDFGLGVMFRKQVGAAFDIGWRFSQGTYTGLNYRPVFYSFDGVFQPARLTTKRFVPELRAGIGGAALHFASDQQQNCLNGPGCQNSDHFQVHLALAGRIYLTDHLFVRPAIDGHWVHQFTEFATDFPVQYSVGIGYSLGRE